MPIKNIQNNHIMKKRILIERDVDEPNGSRSNNMWMKTSISHGENSFANR